MHNIGPNTSRRRTYVRRTQNSTLRGGSSKVEVFWGKAGKSVFQEKRVKGILQILYEYVTVSNEYYASSPNSTSVIGAVISLQLKQQPMDEFDLRTKPKRSLFIMSTR